MLLSSWPSPLVLVAPSTLSRVGFVVVFDSITYCTGQRPRRYPNEQERGDIVRKGRREEGKRGGKEGR